jgi:LacI family transcriptional regulator
MTTPRLTTVKQPIEEMAAAAVAVLLSKQDAPGLNNPLLLACEILEGETTSPPQPD